MRAPFGFVAFREVRSVAGVGRPKVVGAEGAAELPAAEARDADWHRIWPELIGAEGAPELPAAEARDAA